MHKLLFAFIFSFLFCNISFSQKISNPENLPIKNSWFLKVNPFAILETDAGIGFSGEYFWAKSKLAAQLEIQPIFFTTYTNNSELNTPTNTVQSSMPLGIELRPEFRAYFQLSNRRVKWGNWQNDNSGLFYISIDYLFKYVNTKRVGNFSIPNIGGGSYNQIANYDDNKMVHGVDVKFGRLISIGQNGHWFLETFIGFGIRKRIFSIQNIPLGATAPARFSFLGVGTNNSGNFTDGISLPFAVKLVYKF